MVIVPDELARNLFESKDLIEYELNAFAYLHFLRNQGCTVSEYEKAEDKVNALREDRSIFWPFNLGMVVTLKNEIRGRKVYLDNVIKDSSNKIDEPGRYYFDEYLYTEKEDYIIKAGELGVIHSFVPLIGAPGIEFGYLTFFESGALQVICREEAELSLESTPHVVGSMRLAPKKEAQSKDSVAIQVRHRRPKVN